MKRGKKGDEEATGCLIFDEAHKAKNLVPAAGTQPTRIGLAVQQIQAELKRARVIYASATGCSEVRHLGYMSRLGIWGADTSFSSVSDFVQRTERGGAGASEILALEMKVSTSVQYFARLRPVPCDRLKYKPITGKTYLVPVSRSFLTFTYTPFPTGIRCFCGTKSQLQGLLVRYP